ncbi:disulfide bond formation protein B [Cysteiniphilum sp. QT6929]|uniref:disulfide bond formation protein B n=1 Tax=Cysteiniphilum sp. QT6929 TaxID=2975055 RepID=UPI0024B3B4BF|nr:disulfide bond formation protein B [Cysteiniphilum sp. QT6929]WHN66391.1 disulfide bond formation protein B [Cysteiniphilum sp. QT6929]
MHGFKSPQIYLKTFIIGLLVIAGIIYFELTGLKPCPMCLLQQFAILLISILSLVALIHKPKIKGVRIYSFILGIIALLGALVALKQVWMQINPSEYIGSCEAGVDSLFQNLPFLDFLKSLFTSGPDCSQVDWQLFGLSMASYSFIIFIVLSTLHFWQFLFYNHRNLINKTKNMKTEG